MSRPIGTGTYPGCRLGGKQRSKGSVARNGMRVCGRSLRGRSVCVISVYVGAWRTQMLPSAERRARPTYSGAGGKKRHTRLRLTVDRSDATRGLRVCACGRSAQTTRRRWRAAPGGVEPRPTTIAILGQGYGLMAPLRLLWCMDAPSTKV